MDHDGKKQEYRLGEKDWRKEEWYNRNDTIVIKIAPDKEGCLCKECAGSCKGWLLLTVTEKPLKTSFRAHLRSGGLGERTLGLKKADKPVKFDIPLPRSGRKYSIRITRYNSWEAAKRKDKEGVPIFTKTFKTYDRYHWAINFGLFIPLSKTDEYELLPIAKGDVKSILTHNESIQLKTLVYLALYPFGIEPRRSPFGKYAYKNLHLNIGVEISKNVLKNGYFGIGYQIKYVSLDVFYKIGKENVLAPGFEDFIENRVEIDKIPLIKENINRWGLAISLSFPIAEKFSKILAL